MVKRIIKPLTGMTDCKSKKYWEGSRPYNEKRWQYTTSGKIICNDTIVSKIFHLYRRYAKQWNDIELNNERCLSEHTHRILGAKVIGGVKNEFILAYGENSSNTWIMEVYFSRGFHIYYPGLCCGLNTLRTTNDIRNIHLHWAGKGNHEFIKWLELEAMTNKENGEWLEYKK